MFFIFNIKYSRFYTICDIDHMNYFVQKVRFSSCIITSIEKSSDGTLKDLI